MSRLPSIILRVEFENLLLDLVVKEGLKENILSGNNFSNKKVARKWTEFPQKNRRVQTNKKNV